MVTTSISGNTLKIIPKNNSNFSGKLQFIYKIDSTFKRPRFLYQAPYLQDVMIGGIKDPAKSTLNVKVLKNGNVKIKKVDADTGKAISGAKFNELSNVLISMIGLVLFVCASIVVFVRRKSHK